MGCIRQAQGEVKVELDSLLCEETMYRHVTV